MILLAVNNDFNHTKSMSAQEDLPTIPTISFGVRMLPFLVLLFFLVVSGMLYVYVSRSTSMTSHDVFHQHVAAYMGKIEERMERDIAILRGLQGLFLASDTVSHDEFATYLSSFDLTKNYSGIYSLAYAKNVTSSDVRLYEQMMNERMGLMQQGSERIAMYPVTEATDHMILTYIYPEAPFVKGLGFDMFSEPVRKAAIMRALETNEPILSDKIALVSDQSEAALMFLPIYKQTILDGVVMVTLQMNKLFSTIVLPNALDGELLYTVHGENDDGGKTLIYDGTKGVDVRLMQQISESTVIGRRTWTVTFFGNATYGLTSFQRISPIVVSGITIVIGMLLFLLIHNALTRRQQAIVVAEGMVSSLKESELRFRAITDSAKDAIVMMDSQTRVTLWNPAAVSMFGYTTEEVLGKPLHAFITTTPEHQKTDRLVAFGQTGESDVLGKTLALPVRRKDGTIFTIELTVAKTKLGTEWYAIGIMRDVTERVKKEQELADQKNELERMNKIMVDRELAMIELKKQISSSS